MKINIFGSRGSLPTPSTPQASEQKLRELMELYQSKSEQGNLPLDIFLDSLPRPAFGGYGGDTTSVQVQSGSTKILIDAGSGIRSAIGEYMASGCGKGQGEVHIFFTHFHWDHILGLLFFPPVYIKGNKVFLYAVQDDLEDVMRTLFKKPMFPVPFDVLESDISFVKLEPRQEYKLGSLSVTPYMLDHPDPCWGYKVSDGAKTYSHCVDTECIRVTPEDLGDDLGLYQNVDIMLFDAQYSFEEAIEKQNWGHGSAPKALDLAISQNVGEVIFTHHDPMASDKDIYQLSKIAVKHFENHPDLANREVPIKWAIAYDGMEIEV